MEKLGQFLADNRCLRTQDINGTRESLQQLDYGIGTFDDTTMRAVVNEKLEALRTTRNPTQRSNRSLEEWSAQFLEYFFGIAYLVSVHRRPKLSETESASDRYSLSRVTGPQETIGVSAQRYDHYDVYQGTVFGEIRSRDIHRVSMRSMSCTSST